MSSKLSSLVSHSSDNVREPESRDGRSREGDFLLFAFEYPPVSGGIARLCAAIGEILGREHAGASVLTQACAELVPLPTLPEMRVSRRRPLREWQAFRWLRKQRRKTPAVSQTTICGVWYPEGLIAYLAGVRPLVILAHGSELLPPLDPWRRRLWKALQRHVLERASLVIANSDYTKALLSHAAPKAHVEAIPLAVDTDRFAPGNRDVAKAKFGVAGKRAICTVSRIYHYKAHDAVFQAIANLSSEERKDLVYLIAGEGPYEPELREKATGLGVDSHVRWVGFVAEDELPQLYRASDLFVLCTRDAPEERSVEGFGLVFLEAQSCGTPVVGTRIGGIPSAIHDGEGGWLIEQDDSEKLTAIIRQLLRSPECFVTAGKESRQRVLRESTWKSYGCQFSSALRSVGIHYAESKTGGAPTMTETRQGVSVVVPTLNRGSYLHDTLSDLVAQDYRPLEILVVDQSDEVDPELMALVRNRSELISYHKVQFRGLPSARNYGAQHAKYEALVFVDDDIRCGPWLVSEHLRALAKPNVGMGAGGIDERTSARASNSIPGQFNSWTATPVRSFGAMGECLVHHVAGCNFSVWRSVLDGAGGFDEALSMGAALYEETELCLRVRERGFAIGFNGSARVQHLVAGNGGCRVADLPKYMEALAHNRAIVIGRHLRWFQAPTAYIRLLLLFISYAAHYHELGIFWPGLGGLLRGLRDAKNAPVCSHHEIEVHA